MNINKKLKDRRLELGLTLEDVGKIVGVGKSTVRKWETGDIENMRRDKIALLAKALQVSPSFIMGWEDEKPIILRGDGLSDKAKSFLELYDQLDPDIQSKLDELARLYLDDQRRKKGNQ